MNCRGNKFDRIIRIWGIGWKFPPRYRTPATCWPYQLRDQLGLSAPDWPDTPKSRKFLECEHYYLSFARITTNACINRTLSYRSNSGRVRRRIHLPCRRSCLRILHIRSYIGPLTTVLSHITFPHSAILNLSCAVRTSKVFQIDFSKLSFCPNYKILIILGHPKPSS